MEQSVQRDIDNYYADPLGYVMYVFPWGQPGTPLANFKEGPDKWHLRLFAELTRHILDNLEAIERNKSPDPFRYGVASGHGVGKSACMAWLIKWLMATRPNCRGVVTANTEAQLKGKTWAELSKWNAIALDGKSYTVSATAIWRNDVANGERTWRFDALPWSEERSEGFAGLHNAGSAVVLIFDEASAIPDSIWEVAEGAMTDGEAYWFAFGNPTRNTGRFREIWGKFRGMWRRQKVDSRTVRITNKKILQQWQETYGEDSDFFKVRVRGEFPSAGDKQLIPVEIVDAAQQRELPADNGAPLIMGVDVARFGSAESVVRFRQGRDARSIPAKKWRGLDNMQLAYRIAELIDQHNPDAVNIDAGNGSGVIDRLRELGYRVNEVWFAGKKVNRRDAYNMRSSMWLDMRDWLNSGAIDGDKDLYDDLIGPEYGFSGPDGDKIVVEPKEKMVDRGLSSPDNGDALALTFAVRVAAPNLKVKRMRARSGQQAEGVDYNVYSV
ncbi:MAG: terminase [Dehalococcoidia bacterium]|nr:MAG: terminase [Dehalococcoidia bacterium]